MPASSRQTTPRPPSRLRSSLTREHGFEPLRIEGTLPADLNGTLFRNGPGLYECFGRPYSHLFEGDGAICAVRIAGGNAHGAHRVVVSEGLRAERERQKPLYGLNAPWWRRVAANFQKKVKNTGNTSVMTWQGKLYALMEAALPIEVAQTDLTTIGETDLEVVASTFSAHPHYVPGRKAIFNFGLRYRRHTELMIYELPDSGHARLFHRLPLAHPVMLHDFIASDRHLVFLVSPAKIRPWRAMLSIGPFEKLFYWDPREGTEVIVVPLDDPSATRRFHTDAFFQFHFANAFEDAGEIVVDFVRYDNFDILQQLGDDNASLDNTYVRARIDPKTTSFRTEVLAHGCEFPQVHPNELTRSHSHVWMVGQSDEPEGSEPDGDKLVCLDLSTGRQRSFTFSDGRRTSEPVFVPQPGDDNPLAGHILCLVYDPKSENSHLAVFAGPHMEDGPVARLWFDHHVPTTFHGHWVADA